MRKWLLSLLATLSVLTLSDGRAADGALDTTFGGTGIVRVPLAGGYHGVWNVTGVAVQSTGKIIVSGWINENTQLVCFVLRLNRDGSVDPTFTNHNSLAPGYSGYGDCRFHSIAVRPNDAIVAAGEGVDTSIVTGIITQFTVDGGIDASFAGGDGVNIYPSSGDPEIDINRIALDAGGNVYVAGRYTHASGANDFYTARVSADGSSTTHATLAFPATPPAMNNANARDVAIDSDGSYYILGNVLSTSGDYNCALVHYSFSGGALVLDPTFTGSTATSILANDYTGNKNDECPALALRRETLAAFVIGGRSTYAIGSTVYDAATATSMPQNGNPGQRTAEPFDFDYTSLPMNGDLNRVDSAIVNPYDQRALFIGSGPNHSSSAPVTGTDIGVLRLASASTPDASFGSHGFVIFDIGSSSTITNDNFAGGAALWHGSLVIAGSAEDPLGGTNIVVIRLAPFDGIFRGTFESLTH